MPKVLHLLDGVRRIEHVATIRQQPAVVRALWRRLGPFPAFLHDAITIEWSDARTAETSPRTFGAYDRRVHLHATPDADRRLTWSSTANSPWFCLGVAWFLDVRHGSVTELQVAVSWKPTTEETAGEPDLLFGKNPLARLAESVSHFKHFAEAQGNTQDNAARSRAFVDVIDERSTATALHLI